MGLSRESEEGAGSVSGGCVTEMLGQRKRVGIRICAAAMAVLVIYVVPGLAQAGADSASTHEFKIKAAFIYNFLMFVDGCKFQQGAGESGVTDPNNDKMILIGVMGKNLFEDAFVALENRRINEKKVTVHYLKGLSELNSQDKKVTIHPDIESIRKCDVLFICSSEGQYISDILGPIRTENILTIADTQGFLEKGGIINFLTEEDRVRFDVNTAAAKRAKLAFRAKLLRLAKRVLEEDSIGAM